MYPLKLKPHCKDYIWGGKRLKSDFGKVSNAVSIAESWELSCHKDGESEITNGEYCGFTLTKFIETNGKSVLGSNCEKFQYFPILIKLIDAKDNLSVQVHPSNQYALQNEGEYGKTEMWYIVDCEEGAELLYGFNKTVTKDELRVRILESTLLEVINRVPVHKGDVFFIEAGTLHAICKGVLVAEIQQNSNVTYRIYDYDRVDSNGKKRELQIEKALKVIDLEPVKVPLKVADTIKTDDFKRTLLQSCEYFNVNKIDVYKKVDLHATSCSFNSILVLNGKGRISDVELVKGDSCFIPAGYGEYTFIGKGEIIVTDII